MFARKEDFLKNLSQIISEAEESDPDNVVAYINEYRKLKLEKTDEGEDTFGLKKYTSPVIKGIIIFAILYLFTLFAIIIVLLLLLSIERNTRRETSI